MKPTLIILAAGEGKRLKPYTNDRPKCMVQVAGKPVIQWQVETAKSAGFGKIVVVTGYMSESVNIKDVTFVKNKLYDRTNMVQSLFTARDCFGESFVVSYGDIIFEGSVLEKIASSKDEISVVVDMDWRPYWQARSADIFSDAETLKMDKSGNIYNIGQKTKNIEDIQAQYIGLSSYKGKGVQALKDIYDKEKGFSARGARYICKDRSLDELYMTDLIQGLINEKVDVKAVPIDGKWIEIDTIGDLELAKKSVRTEEGRLLVERP